MYDADLTGCVDSVEDLYKYNVCIVELHADIQCVCTLGTVQSLNRGFLVPEGC